MQETHDKIKKFIRLIASEPVSPDAIDGDLLTAEDSAHHIMEEVFTKGNCANFAFALKVWVPEGVVVEAKIPGTHMFFLYDEHYYDIRGDVTVTVAILKEEYKQWREVYEEDVDFDVYSFRDRGPSW